MHSPTETPDVPEFADPAFAQGGFPKLASSTFVEVNDQGSAPSGGWDLHYAQLGCGQFSGSYRELTMPHFQVLREITNIPLGMYGTSWTRCINFAIALRMQGTGSVNGLTWGAGDSVIIRGDRGHEAVVPPADSLCFTVDARVLEDYLSVVEGVSTADWLLQGPIVLPGSAAIRGLAAHLLDLLDHSFGPAPTTFAKHVQRDILHEVLACVAPIVVAHLGNPGPSRTSIGRYQLVQRAREFVLDRVAAPEPVQIIDVCRALNVSRRNLQYSFEEVLGLNPATYLRILRLNRARKDLLAARDLDTVQVKDVVSRWGFWHLSRFSAEYRELYGELPSATLKNARRKGLDPARMADIA